MAKWELKESGHHFGETKPNRCVRHIKFRALFIPNWILRFHIAFTTRMVFFSFFHKKKKHWTGKNCMQTLLKCWNWCQFLITRKFVGMLDSYSLSFCLFSISIQFISFQRFAICTAFTVGELNWKFCCHSDNESI